MRPVKEPRLAGHFPCSWQVVRVLPSPKRKRAPEMAQMAPGAKELGVHPTPTLFSVVDKEVRACGGENGDVCRGKPAGKPGLAVGLLPLSQLRYKWAQDVPPVSLFTWGRVKDCCDSQTAVQSLGRPPSHPGSKEGLEPGVPCQRTPGRAADGQSPLTLSKWIRAVRARAPWSRRVTIPQFVPPPAVLFP